MDRIRKIAHRLASSEVPALRPYLGSEVEDMATETIFMGIQGPATATTEQLIAQAAKMLKIHPANIQLEDEVEPGSIVFNAEMPEGYYDEHEDGEELVDGKFTLSWEPG